MDIREPHIERILVAFDGSSDSLRALNIGCSLAEKYGASLIIAHVYTVPIPVYASGSTMPLPEMGEAADLAKQDGLVVLSEGLEVAETWHVKAKGELLEARSTLSALVEYSTNEKVDLIVVGNRGMSGFKRLIMGSVSSGLVHDAECPVLVVR
ncbi:MAG: universal stress protein [Thaumarchaeota archaeon]|nr:universal stress protein [Nitrososphaerota archaeon]